jgi:hypothetical protein
MLDHSKSGNGANYTARVTSFTEVWLTESNKADINAIIRQVVPASDTETVDAGAMRAALVQ